jgi:hypothetical protein
VIEGFAPLLRSSRNFTHVKLLSSPGDVVLGGEAQPLALLGVLDLQVARNCRER